MSNRLLVVDDEASILRSLEGVLNDEGYETALASSGEECLKSVDAEDPDLILLDVWLPGIDGMETLEKLKAAYPGLPVVMMSGHGNIETAVKATKLGAFDFVEKPLNLDKVLLVIDNALKTSRLAEENKYWRDRDGRPDIMIGNSHAMMDLKEQIEIVAKTRASVLITGENGTGKELVAKAVHTKSKRSAGPFVAVNCAAIPEDLIESELFGHEKGAFTGAAARRRGRFDLANGGTLFLDEIGDMSLKTQAKILRVLEEMSFERVGGIRSHKVDVRVIAATNKDLEAEIQENRFREDLYFRLNVVPFHVPPLRERKEDIPGLVEHFIKLFCAEEKREPAVVDEKAVEILKEYPWPGNVRELKNITERMAILCRTSEITVDDVPIAIKSACGVESSASPQINDDQGFKEARKAFDRAFILRQLQLADWNVAQAAEKTKMDKSSLYKKMKELGIDSPSN